MLLLVSETSVLLITLRGNGCRGWLCSSNIRINSAALYWLSYPAFELAGLIGRAPTFSGVTDRRLDSSTSGPLKWLALPGLHWHPANYEFAALAN